MADEQVAAVTIPDAHQGVASGIALSALQQDKYSDMIESAVAELRAADLSQLEPLAARLAAKRIADRAIRQYGFYDVSLACFEAVTVALRDALLPVLAEKGKAIVDG